MLRRLRSPVRLALIGAALLSVFVFVAVLVTQTAWFRDWLRRLVVRQSATYLNGHLEVGSLTGNLFTGLALNRVTLQQDGVPVLAAESIALKYDVPSLVSGGTVIEEIAFTRPSVRLVRDARGWNFARLVKEQAEDEEQAGPGRSIAIRRFTVSGGSVTVERPGEPSREISGLEARLRFAYQPVRFELDVDRLGFAVSPGPTVVHDVTGRITLEGDDLHVERLAVRTDGSELRLDAAVSDYRTATPRLNVQLTAPRVALAEVGRFVPSVERLTLAPAISLRAEGPLSDLDVSIDVDSTAGSVEGAFTADLRNPTRAARGSVALESLNLAPVLGPDWGSDVTGRATFDLRLDGEPPLPVRGTVALDAPSVSALGYDARNVALSARLRDDGVEIDGRARAYGARATTRGRLVLPARPGNLVAYDLSGRIDGLDLRSLPRSLNAPRLHTDLTGDYAVRGQGGAFRGEVILASSAVEGAIVAAGTAANVEMAPRGLQFATKGSISGVDLSRVGSAFRITKLATPAFQSALTGDFDVAGSGRGLGTLSLTARGRLANSSLGQARIPAVTYDVTLIDRALRAAVAGDFAGLDPGAFGSDVRGSNLTGNADLVIGLEDVSSVSLETLAVSGRLSLGPSSVAGVSLDTADVTGALDDRVVRVERLELRGPLVDATAAGVVALDEAGASDMTYRLAVRDLASLASTIGRPMAGAVTIEGRLTGRGADLHAEGDAAATRFGYGTAVEALSLNAKYVVDVPALDRTRIAARIDGNGSFLRLAGRTIDRLDVKAGYEGERLDFDTTAAAGPRTLSANGRVLLHPDHQEVHLAGLVVGTAGMTWSLPQGTESVVRYGGGRLAIANLTLQNGAQRLSVEGELPMPAAAGSTTASPAGPAVIEIDAEQIQLADLDKLLLGDDRLGGTANIDARVTGSMNAPEVDARLDITGGSVRGSRFDSLAGTVGLHERRLALDVTLQQSPGAALTVRGQIPLSALGSGTPGRAPEEMDVRIESTPFDLALIQGLTTQVTGVTGTGLVTLQVTGTSADPHLDGVIELTNAALTPTATGAAYSGLNARLQFEPDRVVIDRFQVADDDGDVLTIGGALAIHERSIGDVDLAIGASKFEVVDNAIGDIDADVKLRVTGRLAQPRIEGQVAAHSGRINVDAVLDQFSGSPYDASPVADASATSASAISAQPVGTSGTAADAPPPAEGAASGTSTAAGEATPPTPAPKPTTGVLQRAEIAVNVNIPDNLVIRGQDLRPAGSPMSAGDVNATLGGYLVVEKAAGEPGPAITGEVNVERGFYEFQGRRFEIVRGSRLRFEGFRPINPTLRVDAERQISGVTAQVHLRGSMRSPVLTLSSSPPLDEADILSLIVFNAPVNDLGSGERVSLTERAGALAAGFLADPITRSLSSALDLDYFEVRASGERGEPSVAFGEQIGDRIYVRFRQQFGSDDLSEFLVEYRLTDFLRLVSSVAEGDMSGRSGRSAEQQAVDLIFTWSY